MNSIDLLERFKKAKTVAKGSKINRFTYAPFRYLKGMFWSKVYYPITKQKKQAISPTFFGVPMHLDLPSAMDIYLTGVKTHDSELRLTRFMLDYLQEGDTVIDVGAHSGYYSLLASSLVGKTGKVFALEAAASLFKTLQKNITHYPNIQPIHAIISNKDAESATFYEFPALYSEYNTIDTQQFEQTEWFQHTEMKVTQCPSIQLDTIINANKLQPTLIKVDVEGAELNVIEGLVQTLQQKRVKAIAMEFLADERNNSNHIAAMEFLIKRNYQTFLISEQGSLQLVQQGLKEIFTTMATKSLDSDNLVFMPIQ